MRITFLVLAFVSLQSLCLGDVTCDGGVFPGSCPHPTVYRPTCTLGVVNIADVNYAVKEAWRGDTVAIPSACQVNLYPDQKIKVVYDPRGTSGYLTITTDQESKLPSPGTRITPAYKPVMAKMVMKGNTGAVKIGPKVNHVRIRGLYISADPAATNEWPSPTYKNSNYNGFGVGNSTGAYPQYTYDYEAVIGLGSGTAGSNTVTMSTAYPSAYRTDIFDVGQQIMFYHYGIATAEQVTITRVSGNVLTVTPALRFNHLNHLVIWPITSTAQQPDDIVIDQNVYRFTGTFSGRAITPDAQTIIIRDNYFEGSTQLFKETQSIGGVMGVGPITIENNFIQAIGEHIMFGGDPPYLDTEPSATIRFNWLGNYPERARYGPWSWTQPAGGMFEAAEGDRIVFKGRFIRPSSQGAPSSANAGTYNWFMALNTGRVGTVEPDWSSVALDGTIQDGSVKWLRVGPGYLPLLKNYFEIKAAKDVTVQYNVFDWYPDIVCCNAQQGSVYVIKAASYPTASGSCTAQTSHWPGLTDRPADGCYLARAWNINTLNNVFRGWRGLWDVMGGQNGLAHPTMVGNYLFKGNLAYQTEQTQGGNWFSLASSWLGPWGPYGGMNYVGTPIPGYIRLENNTIYTPFPITGVTPWIETPAISTGMFPNPKNRVAGNVWYRTDSASWRTWMSNDGGGGLAMFPGASTPDRWEKNVIIGAPTGSSNYPARSVLSNCGTESPCSAVSRWTYAGSQSNGESFGRLFVNPVNGNFSVRNEHGWAKRGLSDGSDVGADMSNIPEIRELEVTPTDSRVVFQWRVSEPIAEIPCAVELHTAPDFEASSFDGHATGYAAELSQIGTYPGADSDMAQPNIRTAHWRMITLGYAVPLEPDTTHYYRLHCGGDARRGSFKTLTPLQGEGVETLSRTGASPRVTLMELEYGFSYDRTKGIAEPQVTSTPCHEGDQCAVSIQAARGSIVYYRWREKDADGDVLQEGDVAIATVR